MLMMLNFISTKEILWNIGNEMIMEKEDKEGIEEEEVIEEVVVEVAIEAKVKEDKEGKGGKEEIEVVIEEEIGKTGGIEGIGGTEGIGETEGIDGTEGKKNMLISKQENNLKAKKIMNKE